MKRIAFIGTISKQQRSEELIRLYNDSRVCNAKLGIKGVFLVYKNIIVQVMEGDSNALGQVTYRVRREAQFQDFSIILNSDIDNAVFSSWAIRFAKQGSKASDSFLVKLRGILDGQFSFPTEVARQLFDHVFYQENKVAALQGARATPVNEKPEEQSEPIVDCSAYEYCLSSWPKPTQVRPSTPIIKVCSMLTRSYVSYDALAARAIFSTSEELDRLLRKLNELGLLEKRVIESVNCMPEPVKMAANDRFAQLLKKFIQTPRRQNN